MKASSKPKQSIMTISINKKIVKHMEKNAKIGAKHYWSSCYMPSHRMIIKGESNNPKSNERDAVITGFDVVTGRISGKGIYFDVFENIKVGFTTFEIIFFID